MEAPGLSIFLGPAYSWAFCRSHPYFLVVQSNYQYGILPMVINIVLLGVKIPQSG